MRNHIYVVIFSDKTIRNDPKGFLKQHKKLIDEHIVVLQKYSKKLKNRIAEKGLSNKNQKTSKK